MVIDHELTPAQSSAMPKVMGAVVAIAEAPAAGILDQVISHGLKGALIVLEKDAGLLFRSRTLPVMVMGFSIP